MKKYSLIICYFVFFHTVVNSLQCVRDKHVTKYDTEVDWWVTIKMPQYTDLYLYYDSIMDANGETNFEEGYFLRSEDSAFGRALDNLNQDDAGFIAYNDHFVQSTNKHDKRPTKFYNLGNQGYEIEDGKIIYKGAHEKGILAWNGTQGLWIQHTLPNFPNCITPHNKDGPHNISDCPFNVVKGPLNYPKDTKDFLRFSYLGLVRNVFPYNLANDLIEVEGKDRPFIKNPYLRPAQHMVCLSLPTMNEVDLLNKKLSHMLPFSIKDFMTKSSKRKDDIDKKQFNSFANQPFSTLTPKRHPDLYFQLPINPPINKPTHDLMVFNSYVDKEFGCIWNKLVNTEDATPSQPYIDGDKQQMHLSTFVNNRPELKEQYKAASFLANFKGSQLFYYGMGLQQTSDHSKIGFTIEGKPAKVCFSGGNVLEEGRSLRAGSIMICINSGNLRSAFISLLDKEERPEFKIYKNILSINGAIDIYADNAINMPIDPYIDFFKNTNPSLFDYQRLFVDIHFSGLNKIQSKDSNINIHPTVPRALIVREYYEPSVFEECMEHVMKIVGLNSIKNQEASSSAPKGRTDNGTPSPRGSMESRSVWDNHRGRTRNQAFGNADDFIESYDVDGFARELQRYKWVDEYIENFEGQENQ